MRVLIAEDDASSRRILEARLTRWGYEVTAVRDGDAAWEILRRKDAPRLAILDWMLPGLDGTRICRECRKLVREEYVYLILLTSRNRQEDIVKGLNAGADDYIVKPFDPQELQVRLRTARRIIELQNELIAAREAAREQAAHDPLTGLWNRLMMLDILEKKLARARRSKMPLAVVMADLDRFKLVNDRYGHLAGDEVLRDVAQRLIASLRPYDDAARYGGEEFLLVLPGSDGPRGAELAEEIRELVGKNPVDTSEGMIQVTLSLGVASSDAATVPNGSLLIRAADAALYRAKGAGRNRVALAAAGDFEAGLRPPTGGYPAVGGAAGRNSAPTRRPPGEAAT